MQFRITAVEARTKEHIENFTITAETTADAIDMVNTFLGERHSTAADLPLTWEEFVTAVDIYDWTLSHEKEA